MLKYTKKAYSTANFACMRGVTDFTNAAQFNLYESGYSHLFVIGMPKWIEAFQGLDDDVIDMANTFKYILEYEFKGLDGIDDITSEELEVTDGISTLNTIGKVTKQSAAQITMSFTEKTGSAITNFIKFYLEGIKDPRTQAKTYHGLIRSGKIWGGFENEVFTLLYIVTDNTMLQIEKAYLLCNAWPTAARTNIYNTTKGEIEKKDIDIEWQCFVLDGPDVDKRALDVLAFTNEAGAVSNVYKANNNTKTLSDGTIKNDEYGNDRVIHLGSQEMLGGVVTSNKIEYNPKESQVQSQGFSYFITNDADAKNNHSIEKYINNQKIGASAGTSSASSSTN